MPESCEELAYQLSRELFDAQTQTEAKLRDRATNILQAASIVIPVAAIAVSKGPALAAVPFGIAALAYALCAWQCGTALIPRTFKTGIKGGAFLDRARADGADLAQMHETAARHLDHAHEKNEVVLKATADNVERAIAFLATELVALAAALVVTLVA